MNEDPSLREPSLPEGRRTYSEGKVTYVFDHEIEAPKVSGVRDSNRPGQTS